MPRKVSADDPTRMYKSDLLERLTRAHPYEPLIVYIPISCGLIAYQLLWGGLFWPWVLLGLCAGLGLWSVMEYLLHRFLFHYEAKSLVGQHIMKLIHGIHHQFPNDTDRLVIPLMASVLSVILIFGLVFGFTGGHLWWSIALSTGILMGYINYDYTHFATHHLTPKTPWAKAQRRRHLLHHYKYPDACFGVTTGFWDWVFRTSEANAKVAVKEGRMKAYPREKWKVLEQQLSSKAQTTSSNQSGKPVQNAR
ncbi:MAG: sterol desaturase family protein [Myxococcota bacterium]